jgi:GNAT superfamily N-acetyltransferase
MAFGTQEQAVAVRVFQPSDETVVIDLLQEVFGVWPKDCKDLSPAEFFHWKHMSGPLGPSISLVAEADGAVVAYVGCMPWRLSADGKILMTVRGVDIAVHPDHRRRGISSALIRTAVEHFPEDMAFIWSNPNELSRPSLFKQGYRQVNTVPRFLSWGRSPRQTLRWVRAGARPAADELPIDAPTAAAVLAEGRHAALLQSAQEPTGRLATVKDEAYLQWRYGQSEVYRAVTLERGADLAGMAIFRVRRRGRLWISQVCELFVEHGDWGAARKLLSRVRDAAPADLISCNFGSRAQGIRCGFVQWPPGTVLATNLLLDGVVPDPRLPSSWALSLGDLDII